MAAVQAAPAPPASASIVGHYYKRRASDALEERDGAFDERDAAFAERDAAFVERDMAADERDMALEEVERLEALVAELKEEFKQRECIKPLCYLGTVD